MKLSVNETTGFWLWLCPYSTSFDFKICLRARKVYGALGVSRNGARVLLCNLVNNSVTRPSLPASWLMLISKTEGAVSVYSPKTKTNGDKEITSKWQNNNSFRAENQTGRKNQTHYMAKEVLYWKQLQITRTTTSYILPDKKKISNNNNNAHVSLYVLLSGKIQEYNTKTCRRKRSDSE